MAKVELRGLFRERLFRRLLAVLLNGRSTIVRFAPPISLRSTVDEGLEPERTVRKLQRGQSWVPNFNNLRAMSRHLHL